MDIRCEGRRAIVSAGASGIGLAIARKLSSNGARVIVCDIDKAALAKLASTDPALISIYCNVSDPNSVKEFVHESRALLGEVDILINNAGISGPTKNLEDISIDEWAETLAVNLNGQFYLIKYVAEGMKALGKGSIVCISSAAGRLGFPLRLPYATSKRALLGMVDTIAMELGPAGINVNAILPGYVTNDRAEKVLRAKAKAAGKTFDEILSLLLGRISMRTGVNEEEVASLALYLCSEHGKHISGQHISIDGNLETYSGLDNLDN